LSDNHESLNGEPAMCFNCAWYEESTVEPWESGPAGTCTHPNTDPPGYDFPICAKWLDGHDPANKWVKVVPWHLIEDWSAIL
jgi:hypothetical protein